MKAWVANPEQLKTSLHPVQSWNPVRDAPNDKIAYIDLGAVDNDRKVIGSVQRVLGRDAPSRARQLVKAGDILVSTVRPYLNGVARVPIELDGATASTGFCVLRANEARADPAYLFHWVQSPSFISDMILKSTGASYPAVSDKIIGQSFIPAPPPAEQKRIAAILDQADHVRASAIRAKRTLEALPEPLFFDMFGDPESPTVGEKVAIDSVAELINGDRSKNYPSGDDLKSSGVLFLSTANLSNGRLVLDNCNYITEEKFSTLSRGKLRRNDLIITLRGTLGQCAMFDCAEPTGFINAQMMIIRCGKQVIPRYLLEVLRFRSVQARLQRENSGTAVPQLTAAQIGRFSIPVPAIDWQRQFVDAVNNVADKLRLLEQRSARMSLLFTSLQHRAFRGEL